SGRTGRRSRAPTRRIRRAVGSGYRGRDVCTPSENASVTSPPLVATFASPPRANDRIDPVAALRTTTSGYALASHRIRTRLGVIADMVARGDTGACDRFALATRGATTRASRLRVANRSVLTRATVSADTGTANAKGRTSSAMSGMAFAEKRCENSGRPSA